MNGEYGGESVVHTDENGKRRAGFVHDKMPGSHGFTGVKFLDGTFDFVDWAELEYL